MRVFRAAVTAALAVAVGAGLSGCTPEHKPILALAVRDGRPTGVLFACAEFATISVYHQSLSWRVVTDSARELHEIPLLSEAPAGWELSGQRDAQFTPGVRYSLSGTSGRRAIPVEFTTDDLGRIPADKVLVPDDGGRARLVARSEFEAKAREACRSS